MKNKITKYISLVLISVLLVTVSCEKWIDPKINNNPDALTSVPLNQILPNIEVAYGYEAGTFDMTGTPGIFMNYFAGVDRQASAIDAYTLNPGDVNNIWNTYYAGLMQDCKKMIAQANTAPICLYYSGVGKVILAASMGNITSVFGDMPYSEAFQGTDKLQPKFDTQQEIYADIQALLDEAITELSADASQNYYPIQNDLIYGGDNDLWLRAAQTLKARYAMHLSKKGDVAAADAALAALGTLAAPLGLTGNADDANVPFSSNTPTEYNPLYQFNDQRSGYIESDPDFMALLAGDPRLDALANADVTLNAWCQQGTPVPIVTYVEACFLFSEASLIKGNNADAATAYNNGLEASLNALGVFDQTWFDANVQTAGTITREAIITAKYIGICPSIEAYTDFRRTGFPVLTANPGNNNGDVIPVRFPYPTDESNYNLNTPTGVTINTVPWAFQ